jgi:hypothetical protein
VTKIDRHAKVPYAIEQVRAAVGQDGDATVVALPIQVLQTEPQLELDATRVELGDDEHHSDSLGHQNTLRNVHLGAARPSQPVSVSRSAIASL